MPGTDAVRQNGHDVATKDLVAPLFDNQARHERSIDEIYGKINEINSRQGKTNWQTIIAGLGVAIIIMGGMWALGLAPVNQNIDRIEKLNWQRDESSKTVWQRLNAADIVDARLEEKIAQLIKVGDIQRDLIRRLENEVVTKENYTKDLIVLQRNLEALAKKVDDAFPPAKVMDEMLKRLAAIEDRIWRNEQRLPPAPPSQVPPPSITVRP